MVPQDVNFAFRESYRGGGTSAKSLISLVPGEGLEPPTNGLQNRCSTAELTRLALTDQSFASERAYSLSAFLETSRSIVGRLRDQNRVIRRGYEDLTANRARAACRNAVRSVGVLT
jgi:hypothetical protein